jgi:hypothetical protein
LGDVAIASGLGCIAAAVWIVYPPAAILFFGGLLVAIGWQISK